MISSTIFNQHNLHFHMNYWRLPGAAVSGLLLSAAFPPLEWSPVIWAALLPLILLPVPSTWRMRFLTGYIWGYIHSASSLLWLNEVGFGAGFLLSFYCALYPMLWYVFFSHGLCLLTRRSDGSRPRPPGLIHGLSSGRGCLLALGGAVLWVSLEWLRSWFLTGFPWNQLGIALYRKYGLIQIASWTGVYGLSFLIILINIILAVELVQLAHFLFRKRSISFPWHLIPGILFFIPVYITGVREPLLPPPDSRNLLVSAIQGNIPQCRFWSEEEYLLARDVYSELTRKDFRNAPRPDLFIWPECAVPASLDYPPYHGHLNRLLKEIDLPFLIGATQYRSSVNKDEEPRIFNSAFYLRGKVAMDQYYDKIHRVPFGEYVPGSRYFPRLNQWLGMGRDLTPGQNYTLFQLPRKAVAGVNICFEDVFPEISRAFTLRGANLLMTLTNDAWYNESAGSRQHLSHVVFRAVENRRPLLRSGNNSDTCLITPDGQITGIPKDPDTGSRFFQCAARYNIPVSDSWGTTFYTAHGNVFAAACNLLTLLLLGGFAAHSLHCKKQRYRALQVPDSPTP